jgi:hypothetical protein
MTRRLCEGIIGEGKVIEQEFGRERLQIAPGHVINQELHPLAFGERT